MIQSIYYAFVGEPLGVQWALVARSSRVNSRRGELRKVHVLLCTKRKVSSGSLSPRAGDQAMSASTKPIFYKQSLVATPEGGLHVSNNSD